MENEWHRLLYEKPVVTFTNLCLTSPLRLWQNARSISTVSIVLWLTLRGCRSSLFLIPLDKTTTYVYSLLFCQYTQDSCKGETVFPNIQMPFGVHTVSDREL